MTAHQSSAQPTTAPKKTEKHVTINEQREEITFDYLLAKVVENIDRPQQPKMYTNSRETVPVGDVARPNQEVRKFERVEETKT